MDKKFEITLRDFFYLATMLIALVGTWYSTSSRIREIEMKMEAKNTIDVLKLTVLENKVVELNVLIQQNINNKSNKK